MTFSRKGDVRRILQRSRDIARADGSSRIEAEHIVLALAGCPATVAHSVLSHAGLTPEAFADALSRERAESLAVVGVTMPPPGPGALVPAGGAGLGASARLLIERAHEAAKGRKERPLRNGHLLIGALCAEVGRVPRALAIAGVDRGQLLLASHDALDHYLRRAS